MSEELTSPAKSPAPSWLLPEADTLEKLAAYEWDDGRPKLDRDRAAMLTQAGALYAARRWEIETLHQAGGRGADVVAHLSTAADQLLEALFHFVYAAHEVTERTPDFALAAVGGYGRGELNPYSDLDLLFVAPKRLSDTARAVASDLLLMLWDLHLDVGHSVRTFRDCVDQALSDRTVRTAMMETRFLAGAFEVHQSFVKEVRQRIVASRPRRYIEAKLQQHFARLAEQGSIFVREPNVKEGVGGLRDIHFAGWVGKTRYKIGSFEELMKIGSISASEREFLVQARSFLWRVRNDLHFRAGRKSDVLSFDQQVGLADYFGYKDQEGVPASVFFMRYYYRHAQQIHFLSDVLLQRFAQDFGAGAKLRTRLGSRSVGDGFVLRKDQIGVPLAAKGRFEERPERLLALFELSIQHQVPISHDTLQKMSQEVPCIPGEIIRCRNNMEALQRLFASDGPVGFWLRPMWEVGLFRRLVPEFEKIEALCQPGPYHRYTVDEHTLRVVDYIDQIRLQPEAQHELFHQTFQALERPYLVYLAGLFHDLGKGYQGDHSQVGARLVGRVMERIGYEAREIELVRRLVAHHLLIPHYSQRLEIHDQRVLATFLEHILDEETLAHLLVLTYADAMATHREMWSTWKEGLVLELYGLAKDQFRHRQAAIVTTHRERKIRQVEAGAAGRIESEILDRYLPEMGDDEIIGKSVAQILSDLEMLSKLEQQPLQLRLVNPRGRTYSQLTVCTVDVDQPGLFAKITGVLWGHNVDVKAAQVRTYTGGVVLDTLQFTNAEGERLENRGGRESLITDLQAVLEGRTRVADLLKRKEHSAYVNPHVRHIPAEVTIDNELFRKITVLSINAEDRPGLLHDIVTTLADLRLYIKGAKIDTQAERVVDSFFVTDIFGDKITDRTKLRYICRKLEHAAERSQMVDKKYGGSRRKG